MNPSHWIRRIVAGLAVALVASIGMRIWLVRHVPRDALSARAYGAASAPSDGALPEFWPVPAFSYHDHDGKPITERTLTGHVSVADFIYTTCANVCPMMTARMVVLERRMTDPSLRFVSFSIDPEHDTAKALAEYRTRWRADPRWALVRTDSTLQQFARGMRIAAERQNDPNNPILHNSSFFLIDRRGIVRGVYDGIDDADLDRLTRDAARLDSSMRATSVGPTGGQATFVALGCAGCHDHDRIAPSLAGLAGRKVQLARGSNVIADAAYVRRSIVEPTSDLVAGYQPLMPSYRAQLSGQQLDSLVGYVMGLEAPSLAASATTDARPAATPSASAVALGTVVTDPVCGMPVRVTAETPSTTRDGRTVFFCSDRCRDEFLRGARR